MSGNENASPNPSPAVNVGFSSIADRYGESSSRTGSRSSGKRSSRSQEYNEKDSAVNNDASPHENGRANGSTGRHRSRRSGGFLLDPVVANGSIRKPVSKAKERTQNDELLVERTRLAQSRLSGESSLRSSPLSREFMMDGAAGEATERRASSRQTSMDASQLVQMALNLSESRKRHVSNTLTIPLAAGNRVSSAPISNFGTVRSSSAARNHRNHLDGSPNQRSPSSRGAADDTIDFADNDDASPDIIPDNVFYTFSPATLSRAEKARKYFELASEHRRLLQNLPPLKPDATAPGNYTFETVSTPGSMYPEITRMASGASIKHVLGRSYNPIQSLRNRRVRIREKRPFPAAPDAWHDPEDVKRWIDEVDEAVHNPAYRGIEDRVQLPRFDGDDGIAGNQPTGARHRRTDTVGSVITRPENSWTIEPSELLADTYWTEKSDNKAYIETRFGVPIFPKPERRSIDAPKISVEMHRSQSDNFDKGNNDDDFEESAKISRRRKLMLPLTGTERGKRNRLISRPSSSSGSSTEGRGRRSLSIGENGDTNIGPLARHMQDLIAKDEKGELTSPELISPARWDSNNHRDSISRRSVESSRRESITRANGRPSLTVPRESRRRSKSADGRVGSVDDAMSWAGDDQGSEPASPIVSRNIPSMGIDLAPPVRDRHSFEEQDRKGSRLPSFRSRSKERHKIGQTDFADGTTNALSPILSASLTRPRTSQDSDRPSEFRRHRTNESVSSLKRLDTNSTLRTVDSSRESSSTVGRILKGGRDRIGGLVFSDRVKNREKLDDVSQSASDVEDVDHTFRANGRPKGLNVDFSDNESDASPRASLERTRPKSKYHMSNLPTFTSSSRDKRPPLDSSASTTNHLASGRQKIQQDEKKAESSDRLHVSFSQGVKSNIELASTRGENRKTYGELEPAFGVRNSLMPFVSTVPGITSAKRHWSIYDIVQPEQVDKITSRDIARVRALLLSSGIKAREIQRRADSARDKPLTLIKAAETAGQSPGSVTRKEEYVSAARMLSDHLSKTVSEFEGLVSGFQNDIAADLGSQLDELQHKATEHLTKLVHDKSDEADAFTVELTTRQPQDLKRVDDAIDLILRRRRRQFRLLRITGFKLLEWLVLGIMWGIWFMVVMFNILRRIIVGILRFLRWLFVF